MVMIVAAIGIVINGATALLFARGREHDINIRGAYLHMMADAGVSAAVVFAGLVILWTGQQWVDPVMSLAVAVVILWGSVGLLKESVWMSLAGVPSGIDVDQVEMALGELDVELVEHFWRSFAEQVRCNLHIELLYGANQHHIIEAVFKSTARALSAATRMSERVEGVPSTKGTL